MQAINEIIEDSMKATAKQKTVVLYPITNDMCMFEDGEYFSIGTNDDNTSMVGTDSYMYFQRNGIVIKTDIQVIDEGNMKMINTLEYFNELKELREDLDINPVMEVIVTQISKQLPTFGIETFIEGNICIVLPQ